MCGSSNARSIGGEMVCSSLVASSKYWKTACILWSMRSTTSRDSLSCWTRLAATASAWARSCSSRNDRGARAIVRSAFVGGGARHAQELGERRRAVGEPARAIRGQSPQARSHCELAQGRLAALIVDRPTGCFVDQKKLVDAG